MRFTVDINLKNDAMQTDADVADALSRVIHQLDRHSGPLMVGESRRILDINGNLVGWWQIELDK